MKKFLPCVLLVAAAAATAAPGAAAQQMRSHTFRCTDRNKSLRFVLHEANGNFRVGYVYVEEMQVAVLTPEKAGANVIKAAVVGNTATDIAYQFHKSPGRVLVASSGEGARRVAVCKARYESQLLLARHHSIDGIYHW